MTKKRLKDAVTLLTLALILGFVATFTFTLFNKLFIEQQSDYISNTLSAFIGAFIAFILVRIAEFFDRLFQRKTKHHDSLIAMERLGNEYQNLIADDVFIIDDFTDIAKRNIEKDQPFMYFNILHEFHLEKSIVEGVANHELLNSYFSFQASVIKLNSSIASTNRFYLEIKDAFLSSKIDQATYLRNVEILVDKMQELKVFLKDLEEENKNLISIARVLIEDDTTPYRKTMTKLFRKELSQKQRKRIAGEKIKLEEEITKTQTEDRKRLDRILEEMNKNDKSES